jgi:hypothetical protein
MMRTVAAGLLTLTAGLIGVVTPPGAGLVGAAIAVNGSGWAAGGGPAAATGSGFTYQGRLTTAGTPATGNYDFQFRLYDAASGGQQVGNTLTLTGQTVTAGLFTVPLDFGAGAFSGSARWLEIAVQPAGGGGYTTLSPRQALTPAPYALSLAPGAIITGTTVSPILSATNTSGGVGLYGSSAGGNGVEGRAGDNAVAVAGYNSGNGYGVYGESVNNIAVYGNSPAGGVTGNSDANTGVNGTSSSGIGVDGVSSSNFGVRGRTGGAVAAVNGASFGTGPGVAGSGPYGGVFTGTTTAGVYGVAAGASYAGLFQGNLRVVGNLSVTGSKSFVIDDPRDPANASIYYAAIEAPDRLNVTSGTSLLDAQGNATITLPDYFTGITRDYRYQLTAIGTPMPNLYVAQEIQGATFRIAGGQPGAKVSWEVTGVRNDPWAKDHPFQVEVPKPESERGTYLYPEGAPGK